ncbi:MAG: amidohydrolase family protein [Desulfobacterales bacterium]|nr:amidohydrolase family protein [Desulfobacterales bacterium]
MMIDIFTHVVPQKYKIALGKVDPRAAATTDQVPTLSDMAKRFAILDRYPDMKQVLTFTLTGSLILNDPAHAVDFAKRANDEMAALVEKHPDRFAAGVASVPTTDMDAALAELDRAIGQLGLKGVLLFTPWKGTPLCLNNAGPIFEKMAAYDLPVWIHPMRPIERDDYRAFYLDHVFGWPYQSTAAMTYLVLDGIFDRWPRSKIVIHHCGALAPFFDERITESFDSSATIFDMKYAGKLEKPLIEYFKMFYTDTALSGGTAGLMCGHALLGTRQLLFGSDMPYDGQFGDRILRNTITSVEKMTIGRPDKEMIYSGNAMKLLKL